MLRVGYEFEKAIDIYDRHVIEAFAERIAEPTRVVDHYLTYSSDTLKNWLVLY